MAHPPPPGQPVPARPIGAGGGAGGPGGPQPHGQPAGTSGPGLPGWARILVGCAIGCGGLLVLGAIAASVAAWWALSTEKQYDTLALAGPDVVGVVHVDGALAEGVFKLVASALADAVREESELDNLPFGGLGDLWVQMNAAQMSQVLPKEVTVVVETGPGDEESALLVAVNLASLPRAMRRLLTAVVSEQEIYFVHEGHTVLDLDDGGAFAFVDGTLLFTSTPEAARRGIDRLLAGSRRPHPQAQKGAMAWGWLEVSHADHAEAVTGMLLALISAGDVQGPVLEEFQDLVRACDHGAFQAEPPVRDQVTVSYILECTEAEAAQTIAAHLEMLIGAAETGEGLAVVSRTQQVVGGRVTGNVVYGDLRRTIARFLAPPQGGDRAASGPAPGSRQKP